MVSEPLKSNTNTVDQLHLRSSIRFQRLGTLDVEFTLGVPWLEAQFPARRREERGCGPVTGKDRASCKSGGAPALWEGLGAGGEGDDGSGSW